MIVSGTEFHRKWVAQCEAAKQIKQRFGTGNALEYLVGEKRLGFIEAADRYAEFAQELPHFLDGIRGVFSLEETGDYVDQLELPAQPASAKSLTHNFIDIVIHPLAPLYTQSFHNLPAAKLTGKSNRPALLSR
jgi:hypothetical protein